LSETALTGMRTLVVGASSGIGRELVVQLVAEGARVVAAARRAERLAELRGAEAMSCDVRDPEQCEQLVGKAAAQLGGLDAVVFAAGVSRFTPLAKAGFDDWLDILQTNLMGAAMVTRAALPHLTAAGSQRRAVFLSSDSAAGPYPGLVAYGVSKGALSVFCRGLSGEYPALRVTDVCVGPTSDTEVSGQMDPEFLGYWIDRWYNEGWIKYALQTPAEVVSVILEALRAEAPEAFMDAHGAVEGAGAEDAAQASPAAGTGASRV
jgi:NAD(P)-dependent dehydrogenase (short-subunit alcohol dehydrogenase family)